MNARSPYIWYTTRPREWVIAHWVFDVKKRRMIRIDWPKRINPETWRGQRAPEDVQ